MSRPSNTESSNPPSPPAQAQGRSRRKTPNQDKAPLHEASLAVALIVRLNDGLFVIGALHDPQQVVATVGLLPSRQSGNLIGFSPPHPTVMIRRILTEMQADPDDWGFVVFLPVKVGPQIRLAIRTHAGETQVWPHPTTPLESLDAKRLQDIWSWSGDVLLELARSVLDPGHAFIAALRNAALPEEGPPSLCIDQSLYCKSGPLCLYGWSPHLQRQIRRLVLHSPVGAIDLTLQIHRIRRPDLADIFPHLRNADHGLLSFVRLAPEWLDDATICLQTNEGKVVNLCLKARRVEWAEIAHFMRSLWPQALSDLPGLISQYRATGEAPLAERLAQLSNTLSATHHADLPMTSSDRPEFGFFALDRAWALGTRGILLTGWRFDPDGRDLGVLLHAPGGRSLDISSRLFPVPRPDVADAYRRRFPDIPVDTGFICWALLPTGPDEQYLVELRPTQGPSSWLRLPDPHSPPSDLPLVNDILSYVPHPRRMSRRLHDLFEGHLGPAISSISPRSLAAIGPLETFSFGVPPQRPTFSILVPLYGRYDFLRHQLAQFADDPDFRSVDLLYLVDDPRILEETLELAAAVHPLFGLPFRVAHAGANLGYAAINNLGACLARAENLVLLNSDVIPLHPGWLTILAASLEHLPEAGAVAPLLLFPGGAVQHAGMTAGEHPAFPNFMMNLHPDKGRAWTGSDTPAEQSMLTTACLMLRASHYQTIGGMDTGYRVGDFEDSDLCLALRQKGERLYLVPAAQLCHLERQSQNLANLGDKRLLLTLYNAWRLEDKIRVGLLPDPRQARGIESCAS